MTDSATPKPIGLNLWFALGAFVLALVLVGVGLPGVAPLALIPALTWAAIGITRAVRIHRWVQARG